MALSQIGSNQSVRACNSAVQQPCLASLRIPEGNDVTIKGWVKKRAAEPRLSQAVVALRVVDGSAIPGARVGSGRIEIERAEHLDDPARRDVNLRPADAGLVRSQRHGAARRRHSGMSSPSSMAFAGGSTATSPTRALNFSRVPCDARSHARSRLPSSLPSPSGLRAAFVSSTTLRNPMFSISSRRLSACSSSMSASLRVISSLLAGRCRRASCRP